MVELQAPTRRPAAPARDGHAPTGPAALRRTVRLYWLLRVTAWRSALQYRMNIVVMLAAGAAYQGVGIAFVWVLFQSVPSLAGWGLGEVAFLYGLRLVAHGVWLVGFDGVLTVDWAIREGAFERMMLRPLNPLVQLATHGRSLLPFGDLLTGLTVLGVAVGITDIDWSPARIGFCVLAVVGGALIEAAVQLAMGSLAFRLQDLWAVRLFVDDSVSILGSYPLGIYGTGFQRLLTYLVPVAFVAYLPAAVVLGRTDGLVVPEWLAYVSPVVGGVAFTLAHLLWSSQIRNYQGVGH